MKRLIALCFVVAMAAVSIAQGVPVRELAPGVFYYFGDELKHRSANCVWVVFKDYVLVIDANYPWGANDILEEIKKTTDKPVRFVFNTHYHHDHTFGNGVFVEAGATIVSTAVTAEEMQTLGKHEWTANYSGQPLDGYTQVFPSLIFDSTLVFDDGTHRVELIRMGPAHTGGDAVAYLPHERILVTGDLFVNGNPWGNNVADPHADYDRWVKVLHTMSTWKTKSIVPGHGELTTVETMKIQRAYLADMLKQVRDGIRAGKSKDEIEKTIDLSRHAGYGTNKVSTARSVKAMHDNLIRN